MENVCCPKFNPKPWDMQKFVWKDKLFAKARIFSLFHIPINCGKVIPELMKKIEESLAKDPETIMLFDENSLFGADVMASVIGEVRGVQMEKLSGVFLTRVFEGPYSNMGRWISEMNDHVAAHGEKVGKLYFWYTTCPRCAKKYGKNYTVIFARVK
jgi:hypothetical protein